MTKKPKSGSGLENWERMKAQGRPVSEHIINIIKASLSAAPFAGALASLISDYIPASKGRRLENFAEEIARDLEHHKAEVRENYLLTEDFAFVFEKCFRGVAENPQREKIAAFRAILVNSAIRTDMSEEEKEYFLNVVNSLSVLHIRILWFMAQPHRYLAQAGIPADRIQGGFGQFMPVAIPGIPMAVMKSAFGDLHRYMLINTEPGIFNTMTSAQGLELLQGRVSDLGRSFIEFITSRQ